MNKTNEIFLKTVFVIILLSLMCSLAFSQTIDMNALRSTELHGNTTDLVNEKTQAYGEYQIRSSSLFEYNLEFTTKYTLEDMLDKDKCRIVAKWYINRRIPELLSWYSIKDTETNRLIAYNFGIGNLNNYLKGKVKLPEETKKYVIDYFTYLERNNNV